MALQLGGSEPERARRRGARRRGGRLRRDQSQLRLPQRPRRERCVRRLPDARAGARRGVRRRDARGGARAGHREDAHRRRRARQRARRRAARWRTSAQPTSTRCVHFVSCRARRGLRGGDRARAQGGARRAVAQGQSRGSAAALRRRAPTQEAFPTLPVVVNGGLRDAGAVLEALEWCDGVMLGREAYHRPYRAR